MKRNSLYVSTIAALYLCAGLAAQQIVITNGGTANAVPKFTSLTSVGDSTMNDVNGKVGIGTAVPSTYLHVKGSGSIGEPGVIEVEDPSTPSLSLLRTNTQRWRIQGGDVNTDKFIIRDVSNLWNPLVIMNGPPAGQGGFVGIKVENPTTRLDVGGDASVRGSAQIAGSVLSDDYRVGSAWPGRTVIDSSGNWLGNPIQGQKGDKGDQGLQGLQGQTGARGATGSKGDMGLQGLQGLPGVGGYNGCSCSYACVVDSGGGHAASMSDCYSTAANYCAGYPGGLPRGGVKTLSCN